MEKLLQGQRVWSEQGRYFGSKRDMSIISNGGFFCQACLIGKSQADINPDPRYCQGCYDFLVDEAEMLAERGTTKHPYWIPQKPTKTALKEKIRPPLPPLNMSTLNQQELEVDNFGLGGEKNPKPTSLILSYQQCRYTTSQ